MIQAGSERILPEDIRRQKPTVQTMRTTTRRKTNRVEHLGLRVLASRNEKVELFPRHNIFINALEISYKVLYHTCYPFLPGPPLYPYASLKQNQKPLQYVLPTYSLENAQTPSGQHLK